METQEQVLTLAGLPQHIVKLVCHLREEHRLKLFYDYTIRFEKGLGVMNWTVHTERVYAETIRDAIDELETEKHEDDCIVVFYS